MDKYKGSFFILVVTAISVILVTAPAPDTTGVGSARAFSMLKRFVDLIVGGHVAGAVAILTVLGLLGAIMAWPRSRA